MKVLIYFQSERLLRKSGIGRAMRHQMNACKSAHQDFTIKIHEPYDMAHINTIYERSYSLLKSCHKKNIPVIAHGHSTYEDFRNSFAFWKIAKVWFNHRIKTMYSNADAIITPTKYSKSLIESYGFNKEIYVCSNGINLEDYSYSQDKIDAFKKKFKIKDGQKVIIGVGMLFERKGVPDFIEIARHFPDIKFIWFGNLSPILRTRVIKKALKHKPKNVIFPGYMDNSIIKGAYLYADLFLFPSYEETEGIVVLESLASKCPTLIRDIGVYKEWLNDGVNCFKANTIDEFVEKIRYILSKPSELEEIKENGYKVVEERTLDKVGSRLKEIYDTVYAKWLETHPLPQEKEHKKQNKEAKNTL